MNITNKRAWRAYAAKTYKNEKGEVTVFPDICKGCGLCIEVCPKKVISYHKDNLNYLGTPTVRVDISGCIFCFMCEQNCPDCAISVKKNA